MAECVSDPLLPQIPWKSVGCTQPPEPMVQRHLPEERATGKELLEDPHYVPIFHREVVPGTQIGPVNPQGFSPTHPQWCWHWMSWACSHLQKNLAPSSLLCPWKRDLPEVGQCSPGTSAADLGKTAQFLLSVEHTTSFSQPNSQGRRSWFYIIFTALFKPLKTHAWNTHSKLTNRPGFASTAWSKPPHTKRKATELWVWPSHKGGEKGLAHPALSPAHGSQEISGVRFSTWEHEASWMGLKTSHNSLKKNPIKKTIFPAKRKRKEKKPNLIKSSRASQQDGHWQSWAWLHCVEEKSLWLRSKWVFVAQHKLIQQLLLFQWNQTPAIPCHKQKRHRGTTGYFITKYFEFSTWEVLPSTSCIICFLEKELTFLGLGKEAYTTKARKYDYFFVFTGPHAGNCRSWRYSDTGLECIALLHLHFKHSESGQGLQSQRQNLQQFTSCKWEVFPDLC